MPARHALPRADAPPFLCYVGMETDLIFTQGVDLPGFASFPLLETEAGRALVESYYVAQIDLAARFGLGCLLESATWIANRDRAAVLGYDAEALDKANRRCLALIERIRSDANADVPVLLSANLGPRSDAYAPADRMSAEEAEAYHREQVLTLGETAADLISAFTFAYPEEAIGVVRAATSIGMPVVVSFTVETDGRLPGGETLRAAIEQVDAATGAAAAYFMINCAHPEHFDAVLDGGDWIARLGGIVANASRCSHAELDNATELDDGDPEELGAQLGELRRRFPQLAVLGGCCGTDMRHMTALAAALT